VVRVGAWAAGLTLAAVPIQAQKESGDPVREALAVPAVTRALDQVGRAGDRAVRLLVELASIAAPSGGEQARAAAVARRMRDAGLSRVTVDSVPNVIGTVPGTSGRALVFVAMLDDLPVIDRLRRAATRGPHRQGDRVLGPGTELQANVAAMLVAIEALRRTGVRARHDLVFATVAREETGLQGMEALYREWKDRALGFVEVLGDGHEIEYGAGGAIGWWRVVAHGPAGHTGEGGLPNVNQAIARAVDAVFALPYPERDRDRQTVINVGIIRSGEVFNHKPATGWFSLDVRSRDPAVVAEVAGDVATILERVGRETGTTLEMVPDFQSPGGQIEGARDSLLTRAAIAASRYLGYQPELSAFGCCNIRVAVSGGTLAVGVHGETGGGRGTPDEWASVPGMLATARHIVLMAAAVGGLER
jgi:acetylornithine deacetylase/succinyl-diaminopimelate desuccinylase-like protein